MPIKDNDPRAPELDAAFAAAMASEPQSQRMSEAGLQAAVLAECKQLGLLVYRAPRSDRAGIRAGGRGWPDLVIAGNGRVVFRELKSAYGETSAEQDLWGWHLVRAGHDWAVWQPEDWEAGRIRAELAALAEG